MRIVADAMVEKAKQIAPEINHHASLPAAWFHYNFPVNTEGNSVLFTEYHIDKIDAFNEYLVIMQLTGEQIYQSIEQGVYKLKWMQSGGLLHVDNHIKYVYDASKEPGKRIMLISIHGEPLIKNKSYSNVTTRSLSEGKAEHPELKLILSTHYSKIKIRDILISHCRTRYSSEFIDESFGKRIICLFPGATPENIVAKLETNMVENKLDTITQEPLSVEKLNFYEFQRRQDSYQRNEKDKASTKVLNESKLQLFNQSISTYQAQPANAPLANHESANLSSQNDESRRIDNLTNRH